MNYRKLMLAMASAVLVASCSSNGEEVRPEQKLESVSFTASMKTLSRATETSFEENDQIIVYAVKDEGNGTELKASGNYANYVKYTYRGNKFVNDQGIVRPTEFGVRYFAMYPNTISSVPTFRFNVKTAQGASGQYTMSDLCTAVSDVTTAKEVNLIFSHRLSHVVVNLQGEALGTGTPSVKLNNVNTGCNVDLNANTFTAYESRSTVYCADNGTNSYKAIIVPQTIEAGSPFLTVTLNGKEHTLKATSDINLTSGKQQVFNLTINKDEIVSFTGNILPWGEEDERIESVIPDEIRKKMEPYIPIYDGVNPPYVEGCYLLDPMVAVYMEDYDGDLSELQWMGEYINLTNQNKNDNTIDMEELTADGESYSIGQGAVIVGEGNNFSILFNTEGTSSGIYNRTALLLSGTKTEEGLKNLQYAFVMVEKGDDPEGVLMEEGVFRVFQDGDGISYRTTWPANETRTAEWIPEGKKLFQVKSSVKK